MSESNSTAEAQLPPDEPLSKLVIATAISCLVLGAHGPRRLLDGLRRGPTLRAEAEITPTSIRILEVEPGK